MTLVRLLGILVRDDDARERLMSQVGDIGLILYVICMRLMILLTSPAHRTLYESKGLEFNDVSSQPSNVYRISG